MGKFNRGDYRTGKRLNMRKVIPYIASQFRKDKIWLRRTKPSKRQYQICLAIDDSSSMVDNHTKQVRKRSYLNQSPGTSHALDMTWRKHQLVFLSWECKYHIWEDLKFKEFKRAICDVSNILVPYCYMFLKLFYSFAMLLSSCRVSKSDNVYFPQNAVYCHSLNHAQHLFLKMYLSHLSIKSEII